MVRRVPPSFMRILHAGGMPGDLRLVMNLAAIRHLAGLTQAEVASKMRCSQATVSRIEHANDVALSDASAFLRACGGQRLRLVCEVAGRPVEIAFPTS